MAPGALEDLHVLRDGVERHVEGWARSVTRAAPFASCWTISRRVGSESAAKARSRTGVLYSTCRWNIAAGAPLSSDRGDSLMRTRPGARICNSCGVGLERAAGVPRRADTTRRCVHVLGRVRSRCYRSDSAKGSTPRAT